MKIFGLKLAVFIVSLVSVIGTMDAADSAKTSPNPSKSKYIRITNYCGKTVAVENPKGKMLYKIEPGKTIEFKLPATEQVSEKVYVGIVNTIDFIVFERPYLSDLDSLKLNIVLYYDSKKKKIIYVTVCTACKLPKKLPN